MPKIRRERTKYHTPARRNTASDEIASVVDDADQPSSKKDKRKQRRDDWLKKLGALHSQQQRALEAEKRAKTVVVGDMMPLCDALEEVELLASKQRPTEVQPQSVKTKTRKNRQRELKTETDRFQQVISLPAFQKDPLGALCEHLKSTQAANEVS